MSAFPIGGLHAHCFCFWEQKCTFAIIVNPCCMDANAASYSLLFDELLEKGRRFCAYRDRSKKETTDRLYQHGASPELTGKIIDLLEKEGFIDEERFARSFARGKFEYNHWGRIRIKQELSFRQIPETLIVEALSGINEDKYQEVLENIASKIFNSLKEQSDYTARGKTAEHCIRKGYEADLVWKVVNKVQKS